MAAAESYPDGPAVPPRARLGADRGRRGHARRSPGTRRTRSASSSTTSRPTAGATVAKDEPYGEVESVKAVSDVIAPLSGEVLEVNQKVVDAPETVNEDPYGEGWLVRIRLSDPAEVDALLDADAYQATLGRAVSFLSLTDADREEMLAAIGVASVEELFRDIPAGVRFGGELDLEPALSEPSSSRTSRSSRRRTSTRTTSSRSSAPASTTTTCRRSSTRARSAASS